MAEGLASVLMVTDAAPGTRRHTRAIIYELAESIRERDQVTYAHCRRVAVYVNRLARFTGWQRAAARELALAGLVHDLGKTWAPNEVLMKPAMLSQSEREVIEKHPVTAAQLLWAFDMPELILDAVLNHHERWDGRGYPNQRLGVEIPLAARLLSVADVFDVVTQPRPYKAAMPVSAARERIIEGQGTAFDPEVVEAFTRLLDSQPDFLLRSGAFADPSAALAESWADHDSDE